MSTVQKHEPVITRLAEQTGLTFAALDYAGHGSHPIPLEKTTREQQFNEVLAVYDALKSRGYERIIVAGSSFGAYMTALLSAKREPYAIILRAPAIYRDEEFSTLQAELPELQEANRAFRESVTSDSDLAGIRSVKNFAGFIYVIEHEIDSVIPRSVPRAYFNAAKRGNYLIIPATDHAPALMAKPEKHFAYIEALLVDVINLIQLNRALTK